MADVVNLNKFRKRKGRAEAKRTADDNRRKHGRSKAERQADRTRAEREQQRHDQHKLDRDAGPEEG